MPGPPIEHQNIRVSLIAPAFDRNELNAGGDYELAMSRVERLVNLYNSSDPVLKRFRFIDVGSPVAAGFLGINARGNPALAHIQASCSTIARDPQVERTRKSITIVIAQPSKLLCKMRSVTDRRLSRN